MHRYYLHTNLYYVVFILLPNQVPNSSPTAASASSDIYGAAVLDACEQIKARMEPIASQNNFSSFAEVPPFAQFWIKIPSLCSLDDLTNKCMVSYFG